MEMVLIYLLIRVFCGCFSPLHDQCQPEVTLPQEGTSSVWNSWSQSPTMTWEKYWKTTSHTWNKDPPIILMLFIKFKLSEMVGNTSLSAIHHFEITFEKFNKISGRWIRSNCSVIELPWMFWEANICICTK